MVETLDEFRDKLRALRDEMYQQGETADVKLVASWVDRLAMALEGLSDSLELSQTGMEAVSENECSHSECVCQCCSEPMKGPKKAKPAKKKAKKPAKKKKRR